VVPCNLIQVHINGHSLTIVSERSFVFIFLEFDLFDAFHSSLVLSGHLYIETFGGHGGNYLDLPKAGQLRDLLSRHFRLAFYRERAVGPPGCGAMSVKLLGKKL
jgi:hypothetical protein